MITYQDYEEQVLNGRITLEEFVQNCINKHTGSEEYNIALDADKYDAQQNSTIMRYVKKIYSATGRESADPYASNTKLCSNFFHRLNTQKCAYLLGNGVSFVDHKKEIVDSTNGTKKIIDETKEKLGKRFDSNLKKVAYFSLIHGVSFGFWDYDTLRLFKITEFVPLWDEETSNLRAGIRFWQIDADKPIMAVFYEVDGFTKLKRDKKKDSVFEIIQEKTPYKSTIIASKEGGVEEMRFSNYEGFPIVPLYGSDLKQSTLVGMKAKIDAFDLINSGFADDIQDCAEIFWIVSGGSGMSDKELSKFRKRLKLNKVVDVETRDGSATPYTQDIPTTARETFLARIENQIYKDFAAFNPERIEAGNITATQINAAYQPMDEESDDFEFHLVDFVQSILELQGIDDTPIFKRNKISNQKEQTDMVLSCADYLDTETLLSKLPFITNDEVSEIMAKKDAEMEQRMEEQQSMMESMQNTGNNDDEDVDDEEEE